MLKMNEMNIGLYHPQRMNRIAISYLLNEKLVNRVKCVDHLFDLYSANYSMAILIEPEISSVSYNPELIDSFINGVSKPVIVVPFYKRDLTKYLQNVVFTNQNPRARELVECIQQIEVAQLHLNRS